MILQYFVTETATERKIPIEIDRATDADLAGTKSCWQTDWTSEFIGDPDLEKYAAKSLLWVHIVKRRRACLFISNILKATPTAIPHWFRIENMSILGG